MKIRYGHSSEAWASSTNYIKEMIIKNDAKRVLEVGGGANPTFSLEFVKQHNLEYTVLDISLDELAKAPDGYVKVCADITSTYLELPGGYDLVFSKMLAEHVKSGEVFHRNVYSLLSAKGRAFHFFPTLYAPPFVVNRLLPERLSWKLLNLFQSGRHKEGYLPKFPAYYSWCRGPVPSQIKRFESIGYQISEYIGFFGNVGYYQKLPFISKGNYTISKWLVEHPIPVLCSFAYVQLQKDSSI
jgi:hypothetical protein